MAYYDGYYLITAPMQYRCRFGADNPFRILLHTQLAAIFPGASEVLLLEWTIFNWIFCGFCRCTLVGNAAKYMYINQHMFQINNGDCAPCTSREKETDTDVAVPDPSVASG